MDAAAPYTAPIQLPWNAGGDYSIGATASTSLTAADGVPAFDLNGKTVFLETGYPGGWGGTITLTHDSGVQMPSTPTNLVAVSGNNQASLTWTASTNASGYHVKRSLSNIGPYTVIASPATASYTDLTAVNGTTYYYVVSAFNGIGETIDSNQATVNVSFDSWAYSGSMHILTTPAGANLSAGASVSNFPLLVRFNSSNFNFAQAQSDGRDIRFTTAAGAELPYQIEQWDAVNGKAAVWVKIPTITGNSNQQIIMYWGKSGVSSLSSGSSVFNSANGYASVIHLGDTLADEIGTTSLANVNSTATNGLIGRGRRFAAGQGIACGTSVIGLPTGSGPFSTGVWIKSSTPSTDILGWGLQQSSQKKVVMQLASPPSINLDCWFGGANVTGTASVPLSEWTYVVHTFQTSGTRLYVNGVLDASNNGGTMQLQTTGRYDIGGWSETYNFVGDMDEVRISNVVRSADWVKLEYENQKPLQSLIGSIVPSGSAFSVSPTAVTINEGAIATLTAQAGGAQKTYWIYKKSGQETLLATDQLTLNYTTYRVSSDDSAVIQFKAFFAGGSVRTIDVPLTVLNSAPDPEFTLIPSTTQWDGRQTITVTTNLTNLAAMQSAGFGNLNYKWDVSGVAVIKQASNGTLTLTRSQGSGPMIVTLTMDNGGTPVSRSTSIAVQEPTSDSWLQRTPGATEKPVNGQFFARDPGTGFGTIFYNGSQSGTPNTVFLKVYKTPSGGSETLAATYRQPLVGGAYAFSAPIAAGLFTYRVVYGTTTNSVDTNAATVTDLVCGDAYIIEGQSNALAISGQAYNTTTDTFVRTYGLDNTWGLAVRAGNDYRIGYWGMPLALYLKSLHNMPICMINAAVGGTRIDQHQANPAGHGVGGTGNVYEIYANLFNRVNGAKLSHGIRGVFWHQGENNSGADSPTGDWDYKSYQQYFVDISADWKRDFPNIQKYMIFQVQPKPCEMGPKGDQLREVQRNLPRIFSNMSILSTIGIDSTLGYDGCHYTPTGYQNIVDLLVAPLVDRDFYNDTPANPVTAPNLKRAYYTNNARNQIALEFDQSVIWNNNSTVHFYLDNVAGKVSSGSHSGNRVTLQLSAASTSSTIDYVSDQLFWDGNAAKLLYGSNGMAVLTFADVAIGSPPPASLSATGSTGQVALTWTATTGTTSYKIKRATNSGGPYATIATTTAPTYADLSVTAGTPYFYVVSAVNAVGTSSSEGLDSTEATATAPGNSAYDVWKAANAPGSNPADDSDGDGLSNALEWVLGGTSATKDIDKLPVSSASNTDILFTFYRAQSSIDPKTSVSIEVGTDLVNWPSPSPYTVPDGAAANNPGVTVLKNNPVTGIDKITLTLPKALDTKKFIRLKVTITP